MNEHSQKNEPISSADSLVKTSNITLTEEELKGVSGGIVIQKLDSALATLEHKLKGQ